MTKTLTRFTLLALAVAAATLAFSCDDDGGDGDADADLDADGDSDGDADGDGDGDGDADGDGDGDGDADGDADADADADADVDSGAFPVRFRLNFISDIPESVWVDDTFPWGFVSVLRGGTAISLENWCGCACSECPECPVCDAPCPSVAELPNGGSVEYAWDGLESVRASCPAAPSSFCDDEVAAPIGAYTARFCFGTGHEGEGCSEALTGARCEDVVFDLPDADGVVEYTIDWGG